MLDKIRNIAIIAHVDHGKTTLVDKLLRQTGTFGEREVQVERVMDSNDLEKERGITILSKNTAIDWNGYHINIVDTPGHADFGGEVERVLSMVDSVLLLVDAVDGPMPQTRFVTKKAFEQGLKPIVVINKIDRHGARPDWVVDQVFDLFVRLGATDEQLDFPIVFASALEGYASLSHVSHGDNMEPLLQEIVEKVSPPECEVDGPLKMQISSLDYSNYLGVIGTGRITRGTMNLGEQVVVLDREGVPRRAKISKIFGFKGLDRVEVNSAHAGNLVAIAGIEGLTISDTVCDKEKPEMMVPLSVDEPTISMTFQVNNSPFVGKEGKFVTSRQIRERLYQEAVHNIALKVEDMDDPDKFKISGRGELHLGILIETMRREGFELAVSQPQVILHEEDGQIQEPYEQLVVDVEDIHQGSVMEALGERRGALKDMVVDGSGRVRLDYSIPSRGLIGFQGDFLTMTSGSGILTHVFDHYGPYHKEAQVKRKSGVLISNNKGKATGYSLFKLQPRGKLFCDPTTEVYEGMLVGIHAKENDLVVNVTTEKQLTNVRSSGTDENIQLTPPIKISLEYALEFIDSDELVEITPKSIRLRKRHLLESDRKRASRS